MNPAIAALVGGFAGWAGENALAKIKAPLTLRAAPPTHYSKVLPGVPLLPVYAAGGAALSLLTPAVSRAPWPLRGLAYAGALTAIEGAAGYAERVQGRKTWDYDGKPVDMAHAALWGLLGLLAEPVFR